MNGSWFKRRSCRILQHLIRITYLSSQYVNFMSIVWRLRKVLVSRGNSMLAGWGMGSQIRTKYGTADSCCPLGLCSAWLSYTRTWPEQCSTLTGQKTISESAQTHGHRHLNSVSKHSFYNKIGTLKNTSIVPLSRTFHVADLTLTVRPLLVRVHFIRRKKLLSVFGSLAFLEPEIKRQWQFKRGNKLLVMVLTHHN